MCWSTIKIAQGILMVAEATVTTCSIPPTQLDAELLKCMQSAEGYKINGSKTFCLRSWKLVPLYWCVQPDFLF